MRFIRIGELTIKTSLYKLIFVINFVAFFGIPLIPFKIKVFTFFSYALDQVAQLKIGIEKLNICIENFEKDIVKNYDEHPMIIALNKLLLDIAIAERKELEKALEKGVELQEKILSYGEKNKR